MRQETDRREGTRANALWGGGKRITILLAVTALAAAAALGGLARPATAHQDPAYTSPGLLADAQANPDKLFDVIVQGDKKTKTDDVVGQIDAARKDAPGKAKAATKKYRFMSGASVQLTGAQLAKLATRSGIRAITRDDKVELLANSNTQPWPSAAGASWTAPPTGTTYPTIAIFDSGVQSRAAFGSRFLGQWNFTTSTPNSLGDGRGHGTMVASVAAGADTNFTGAEPRAKLISLDVLNDYGVGTKSDLLSACDWLLYYKNTYNVRVANFSLLTPSDGVLYDPLNYYVEQLWLNGVVVVAASGNYALNGAQSDVGFAPANDPFVLTVGASDIRGTASRSDDFAAPWSAWGWTQNGFRKPEVAAPGRVMNAAVPKPSTMLSTFPTREVAGTYAAGTSYMWMSGTSFAAPVVAGLAATILSRHPEWTSDQVKGAIMKTVTVPTGYTPGGALGVGVVNGAAAMAADGAANPNAGLQQFVYWDSYWGEWTFDPWWWYDTASTNPSWNQASWSSASWSSASWSSASWSSASWSSASWASASWSSASWASASWASNTGAE